jgi:hypothetical protein
MHIEQLIWNIELPFDPILKPLIFHILKYYEKLPSYSQSLKVCHVFRLCGVVIHIVHHNEGRNVFNGSMMILMSGTSKIYKFLTHLLNCTIFYSRAL